MILAGFAENKNIGICVLFASQISYTPSTGHFKYGQNSRSEKMSHLIRTTKTAAVRYTLPKLLRQNCMRFILLKKDYILS